MRQYRSNQGKNPKKEQATLDMLSAFVKILLIVLLLLSI
tara:strand:+ start:539 stop:655 length:117 start_codon:yes stop_codon:yes gene_type:complete